VHNAQVCYFKKKKKERKKKAQEKSESKEKKKHDKKKVQEKKKKLLTRKLTPGGQFHPIHEISVSSYGFHRITEPLPCQVYQLSVR